MSKKLFLFVSLLCATLLLHAQTVPLAGAAQGDIVVINGVKAIVFKTYGDGHGKAMALTAFRGVEEAWGRAGKVKTTDRQSGRTNTEAVYSFAQEKGYNINDFPVFAWCKSLGVGWYIPSVAELEIFISYWMGNAAELDWDSDSDVAQPQSTKPSGKSTAYGQNEHTKKVNKKITDAGGMPFGKGVFSSTEEGGKILVFEYSIYSANMEKWKMKGVSKGSLGEMHTARAFFDY